MTDGMHPRSLASSSDGSVRTYGTMLTACEAAGDLTSTCPSVLFRMLLKVDGDRRPIGLFAGTPRVWARSRMGLMQDWLRSADQLGVLNLAGGRRITATVWKHRLLALASDPEYAYFVEILLDVTKYYENVEFWKLADLARAVGYPLRLLQISCSAYRYSRRLLWDGNIVSPEVVAVRGVVAGSSCATYEVAVYSVLATMRVQRSRPSVRANLHVDDLAIASHGATEQAAYMRPPRTATVRPSTLSRTSWG